MNHVTNTLDDGSKEIVFETFPPGRVVTVAYLYFAPILWTQVNINIEADEGQVDVVQAAPTRQYPRWVNMTLSALVVYGAIALIYTITKTFF